VLFGTGDGSGDVGDWQRRLHEHLRERGVDYLVVFEGRYPAIVRSPGFRVMHTLRNPDNRTMAGNVLLIVQTPWCRFPLSESEPSEPTSVSTPVSTPVS
jgi:hypothetical protein